MLAAKEIGNAENKVKHQRGYGHKYRSHHAPGHHKECQKHPRAKDSQIDFHEPVRNEVRQAEKPGVVFPIRHMGEKHIEQGDHNHQNPEYHIRKLAVRIFSD